MHNPTGRGYLDGGFDGLPTAERVELQRPVPCGRRVKLDKSEYSLYQCGHFVVTIVLEFTEHECSTTLLLPATKLSAYCAHLRSTLWSVITHRLIFESRPAGYCIGTVTTDALTHREDFLL
jgi:hypothetical protein